MYVPKRLFQPQTRGPSTATLADFGLLRSPTGQFLTMEGKPYNYKQSQRDEPYNEGRFSELVAVVARLVKKELRETCRLQVQTIPVDAGPLEPQCSVLHSPAAFTTTGKLLIIVSSGREFQGIWNRSVLIKEGMQARQAGYEVLLLNMNENIYVNGESTVDVPETARFASIRESDFPDQHLAYVMRALISEDGSRLLLEYLGQEDSADLLQRIKHLAMIESTHSWSETNSEELATWLNQHAANWILRDAANAQPLDADGLV
ncbi:hypothetical protein H4R33_001193 [Dimargaris cristalligena]|nr:hypothetical protein H4R33_001193 [Dimargaris cristalligena]